MDGKGTGNVATLAAAVALGTTTACSSPAPDTLVATPGPDAEPAQVVQALVDAVNARDEDLVRSLTTEGYGDHLVAAWFEGGYLTDAAIGETLDDAGPGFPKGAVMVMVTFTPEGADASMTNGREVGWGFIVTEESGQWQVADAGVG